MHRLLEGGLTGLSVWEVSMRGLPPSISAFFVFLSRCTMSSALPWSAVIRYVPCISFTASISFCRRTSAESISSVSGQVPALMAAVVLLCYDMSFMLPVVGYDEANTLHCLPSFYQHLQILKSTTLQYQDRDDANFIRLQHMPGTLHVDTARVTSYSSFRLGCFVFSTSSPDPQR